MAIFATFARTAILGAGLAVSACATDGVVTQREPVMPTNAVAGVAVKGYDPVAYFTDHKPVPGNPGIETRWHGVTYQFALDEHRKAFIASPDHYAPQFGGFCAFAISRGTIADVDPSEWAVVNDNLYLNNNAVAQHIWDTDRPGNIRAGNKNWPLVPKLPEPAG
jgi:YHS domain-containing protein